MTVRDGPVNLRRLHYFTVLADELHFGRAALRLHIAQPALSQQIKVLETEVGVQILRRDGHRTRLTPAGELLCAEARRLLHDVDEAMARVRARAAGNGGLLRLAYTRSAAYLGTTELVLEFRRLHPEIEVRTAVAWTARNLELLRAQEADVAFVRPPVDEPDIGTLQFGLAEEIVAALPPGHRLVTRPDITIDDILDEDVVFWPRNLGPGHYERILGQVWSEKSPRIVLEEPDDEQILIAVASGAGISLVERRRATKLCPSGVSLRRFSGKIPTSAVGIAWCLDNSSLPVCEFLRYCRLQVARAPHLPVPVPPPDT